MNNAKMQILEMLKEGRITVEDSIKLLEAIEPNEEKNQEKTPKSSFTYYENEKDDDFGSNEGFGFIDRLSNRPVPKNQTNPISML